VTETESAASAVNHLVTVVIPCVEVDPLTARCVHDCATLFPGVEVLVFSDIPDDGGRVAGMRGVRVAVTGKVTIAKKRNMGAAASSRPYLGFIDSDAYPTEGWVANAVDVLEREADVWAVGGPNLSPMDRPAGERYVGLALKSLLVSGKWIYRKRIEPARLVDDLPSCNLIVRRDQYMTLGGMDEALITGEDMEFCARLRAAGGAILYTPNVLVFHKARDLKNFITQRLTYGTSVPRLVHRRRDFDFLVLCLPAAFVAFIATGPIGTFCPTYGLFWLSVMAVYAITVGLEAVRHAERAEDIPGVILALAVGNLMPGVGTWARLFGFFRDPSNIYRNDR